MLSLLQNRPHAIVSVRRLTVTWSRNRGNSAQKRQSFTSFLGDIRCLHNVASSSCFKFEINSEIIRESQHNRPHRNCHARNYCQSSTLRWRFRMVQRRCDFSNSLGLRSLRPSSKPERNGLVHTIRSRPSYESETSPS